MADCSSPTVKTTQHRTRPTPAAVLTWATVLAVGVVFAACTSTGGADRGKAGTAKPGTSTPGKSAPGIAKVAPATAPTTGPMVVKLTDARDLVDLQELENTQINLTDKIIPPFSHQRIYFGEVDEYDPDDEQNATAALPIIALHDEGDQKEEQQNKQWKAIPLVGPGLVNAGWRFVGSGPGPKDIWGVLDTSAGDSNPSFVLAHSADGGSTFSLTAIQKPCRLASVSDFVLSRSGHGRVTLTLDAACGKIKSGEYHYDTTDFGRTWSPPRYEPDAMAPADSVDDDEQPDPGDSPAQTAAWHFKSAPKRHASSPTGRSKRNTTAYP